MCAQAGNVNTGAVDPVEQISDIAHRHGAWVHVDGAFGLWAAASPRLRPLLDGVEQADSWATDAHKWLNVPYDSGVAFCADPEAHRAAMGVRASYLVPGRRGSATPWTTSPSTPGAPAGSPCTRRCGRSAAAGSPIWSSAAARWRAGSPTQLGAAPGVEVLNDVVLNQVLVRFRAGRTATPTTSPARWSSGCSTTAPAG